MMVIRKHEIDKGLILEIRGEVEIYSLKDLEQACSAASARKLLILDLAGLDYIDSSGLGFLVSLHDTRMAERKSLKLLNPPPHVAKIFRITHLDRILDIESDCQAPA